MFFKYLKILNTRIKFGGKFDKFDMFDAILVIIARALSNGHSPANLANSSTRQKFAVFL
jgi:hypothetical protein